ncbi:MAG: Rieske 2Fe-2S domain-containing protein [Tenericutes bacterium]|nr:Rieske 2Fe-2S domain-containing protein [Mycoplasmatota bacterium]
MLHYAIDFNDLKDAFKKRVIIEKTPILLVYFNNQVYAISDKCPHMGASLVDGMLKDNVIQCKRHGAKLNVETGDVVKKAQIGFIKLPTKEAVRYETVIKDDKVFIKL